MLYSVEVRCYGCFTPIEAARRLPSDLKWHLSRPDESSALEHLEALMEPSTAGYDPTDPAIPRLHFPKTDRQSDDESGDENDESYAADQEGLGTREARDVDRS